MSSSRLIFVINKKFAIEDMNSLARTRNKPAKLWAREESALIIMFVQHVTSVSQICPGTVVPRKPHFHVGYRFVRQQHNEGHVGFNQRQEKTI